MTQEVPDASQSKVQVAVKEMRSAEFVFLLLNILPQKRKVIDVLL